MTDDTRTPTAQEMFCCAVANGRGPKVKWLHACAHDYWEKYQADECAVEVLRAELAAREAVVQAARALTSSVFRVDTLIVETSTGSTYSNVQLNLIEALAQLDAATAPAVKA